MLARAQKKNLYQSVYVALLGGNHKSPIEDGILHHFRQENRYFLMIYNGLDTYDVIIASGAFAPGHLYSDVFGDLIRITKPGQNNFFKN